ncbi:sporulation integral membrane protein YtvI [Peribacillus acanthi]|uniref:sporulation integral membrane protein YtvI n=1 Tax=Peribacillus acanthi TaxID=2171554 RepID=UPI000D3E9BDB|nr:sporulation integral membrane protein YtvI [Peribacillus acanthi]
MNPTYIYRFVRLFLVIGIVALCAITIYYTSKVTYPFIIGLIIAFMINPLVDFFEKKTRMPRSLSVFAALILIIAIFTGLIVLLVSEIVSGANYLARVVPQHIEVLIDYTEQFIGTQIIPMYHQFTTLFNNLEAGQQDTIMENVQNAGKNIGTTVGDFIQNFFSNIPIIIGWFPSAATVLIFSLLATFFISKDWYRLRRLASRFTPNKMKQSGSKIFEDLRKALFGFIKAQLTLISITTIIVLIGLLVLRVEYAITIALVAGFVDILPYLGTGAVFVPWIIYEVIAGEMNLAVGLGVLYIVVLVQRQIMEPKILSSSIGLDPLATLVALFVGFKLIGFLGLIVGPVTLVIINTLHKSNVFTDIWSFILGKNKEY